MDEVPRLYIDGVTYDSNWEAARARNPAPLQSLFSSFPLLWCITTSTALLSSHCMLPRDTAVISKIGACLMTAIPHPRYQRLAGGPEDSSAGPSVFSLSCT